MKISNFFRYKYSFSFIGKINNILSDIIFDVVCISLVLCFSYLSIYAFYSCCDKILYNTIICHLLNPLFAVILLATNLFFLYFFWGNSGRIMTFRNRFSYFYLDFIYVWYFYLKINDIEYSFGRASDNGIDVITKLIGGTFLLCVLSIFVILKKSSFPSVFCNIRKKKVCILLLLILFGSMLHDIYRSGLLSYMLDYEIVMFYVITLCSEQSYTK